jgi:crossover junction endonuclease MUS81
MKLVIDNREPKELKTLIQDKIENIELKNLEIGDIIFLDDHDNIVLIFERKSISDLISSIKDGRYSEQSFRLQEYPLHNHNIFYLIEGTLLNTRKQYNETIQKTVYSAMFSLSYSKGFSLLHTSGIVESAEFIIFFFQKLVKDKSIKPFYQNINPINNRIHEETLETNESKKIEDNNDYVSYIKSSKKSHITKENINEIMLSQIPNVSINIAKCILNEYNNIENLIKNLKENSNCLENLKVKNNNGERKISKNSIENIKTYLL